MRAPPRSQRWIFGYGSLMWRPGFDYLERVPARHHGRRRAFCIYSVHHRGTLDRPGLVLGLAPGGSVLGVAYRVSESSWPTTYGYLLEREQPTETYIEAAIDIRLPDRSIVRSLAFLSDRHHSQWAGDLTLDAQADLIAGAEGLSGRNVDYLRDLVAHLGVAGITDTGMARLLTLVEAREAHAWATR
jgi:cation transport protein ChaC